MAAMVRVLTEQERDYLTPEAVALACKFLYLYHMPGHVLETVLLEAMMLSKYNQSKVDAPALDMIMNRIYDMDADTPRRVGEYENETNPRWFC